MADTGTARGIISAEEVAATVDVACRAPSLHNSQPWRWIFADGRLELLADHGRVGRHTDSTGREVILSCGAVLDHLVVAAAVGGWQVDVDRYPDHEDFDHLASIAFRRCDTTGQHERRLREAMLRRRTDRLAFAEPEPWAGLDRRLREVLRGTVAHLDVIDDNGRPALARASRYTEEHRHDESSYRYELLWWTGHSRTEDGVPPDTLPTAVEASHVDVARDFPAYGSGDRRPQVDRDHSRILVLSTYDDSRENTLRCGEALSRVLLECTAEGFATCALTHMIELHTSREIVRRLIGRHTEPQVLVRVGRAAVFDPPPIRTPRRPITDILLIR